MYDPETTQMNYEGRYQSQEKHSLQNVIQCREI